MANFRKSFNFRNGVQVDEDNFVVSSTGLVGIGTSIPTAFLDIRGTTDTSTCLNVVGLATVQDAFIGFGTVQRGLEVGITSFYSGIITAKSGIVTYYGDARYLQGMPTSQWVDVDAGLGYTSIYAAGNVGVGTVDPRFTFQVGGNNNVADFTRGVGINSSGDVIVAGIATITKMYGWGIGVTGLNAADAIATGTLDNDRLPSNINKPTGVVTFSTASFDSLSVTNPITALGGLVGTASTAEGLSGTPNLNVGIVTTTKIVTDSLEVSASGPGITTIAKLLHVGTGGTALAALEGGRLGIGTALPSAEIQIRKSSGSSLDIVSETGESKLNIGQQTGVGNSIGVLRFGNTDKTLDIINMDTGNINMYLHVGAAGIDTGAFRWVYGQDNSTRMSLTYDGNLGIGITDPTDALHVVGTSTFTGAANFASDVTITGSLNVTSITLPSIISSNINATSGVSTFNDIKTIGNVIVGSGQSVGIGSEYPRFEIDASGKDGVFGKIGIGLSYIDDNGNYINDVAATLQNAGESILSGGVGIGTIDSNKFLGSSDSSSSFDSRTTREANLKVFGSFDIENGEASFVNTPIIGDELTRLGIGTADPRSVADFSRAGYLIPNKIASFMILPRVTGAERVGLQTVEGAVIFNTSDSKFQGFDGTTWHDLH